MNDYWGARKVYDHQFPQTGKQEAVAALRELLRRTEQMPDYGCAVSIVLIHAIRAMEAV